MRVGARIDQRARDLFQPPRVGRSAPGARDPQPQDVAPPLRRQRSQRLHRERRHRRSRARDRPGQASRAVSAPRRRDARSVPPPRAAPGQRWRTAGSTLPPQVVAIEALIEVRVILDPGELARAHPGLELQPRATEQRARQRSRAERRHRRHGGEPWQTAAAEELQQHRLELIVLRVRREQRFTAAQLLREAPVARDPRGLFQRGAALTRDLHREHSQRNTEPARELAAMRAPALCIGV